MKNVFVLIVVFCLAACDIKAESSALATMADSKTVWVFAQFNVPEEGELIETYYYYAKVSEKLYTRIANNDQGSGFILLQDVKYWGSNDLIYDYADAENAGEIVFRIEHIVKMKLVQTAPITGLGVEQFEEVEAVEDAATDSQEQEQHQEAATLESPVMQGQAGV